MNRFLAIVLTGFAVLTAKAQETAPLRLVQTIPLPEVEGRIDHFSVDLKGRRLFMSALGNNTLEIFDLRTAQRLPSVGGLHEPQGVFFIPELNKIIVANGVGGAVKIFDGESFKLVGEVNFSDDADNLRYDAARKHIYVGYGDGAFGVIDASNGNRLSDIKLEGHPESFQLEKSGPLLYVNVPTAKHIAVIDRDKRVVVAKWSLDGDHANFPMALDEAHHRLFIACRKPAEVMVFDTPSGKVVARLASTGDADDLWYDAARKRLYVSGGEGFISVIELHDADDYEVVATLATAPGARTSIFVPEFGRLYLAVPRRAGQRAELRIYEARP